MKSYSSREVLKILKADGWYEVNCEGDHHQFKHPTKPGRVTITHPKKRYSSKDLETNPTTGGRHISMTLAAFLTLIFGKGADAA